MCENRHMSKAKAPFVEIDYTPMIDMTFQLIAFFMILEYPLMIAAACMLRPRISTPLDSPRARWAVFGIPSLMVVAAGVFLAVLTHQIAAELAVA